MLHLIELYNNIHQLSIAYTRIIDTQIKIFYLGESTQIYKQIEKKYGDTY